MNSLSILIPFYNAAPTLERTVRSLAVVGIAHRDRLRIIGIDDGSTDGSARIFRRTAEECGLRAELLSQPNGGSGSARNLGLREVEEGWILFLDADDEILLDPFPHLDGYRNRTALLFAVEVFRQGRRIETEIPPNPSRRLPRLITARNPFPILSVVFRAEALENLFDEDLAFLEDWHFWAVNSTVFETCAVLGDDVLGRVHVSATGKSADQVRNGRCRLIAAGRIGEYWGNRLGATERNNLAIQKAIGDIQAGQGRDFRVMTRLPVSADLYLKWIVYAFFFPLYRRLNRYG